MMMLQLFLEMEWIWINLGFELDWVVTSLFFDGGIRMHGDPLFSSFHFFQTERSKSSKVGGSVGRLKSSHDLNRFWCFPRPSSYIKMMMKRTARRLIRLIAAMWGRFGTKSLRFMSNPHGRPPHKNIDWLIFLSRMFPFCPEKPTWTGSMPVIQACFVACFFSCQFLQTPVIVGVLHFLHLEERFLAARSPIVQELFDLFRTDICTSLRYWIQHDSTWKCWVTHSTFICSCERIVG